VSSNSPVSNGKLVFTSFERLLEFSGYAYTVSSNSAIFECKLELPFFECKLKFAVSDVSSNLSVSNVSSNSVKEYVEIIFKPGDNTQNFPDWVLGQNFSVSNIVPLKAQQALI
jgi:hypothetical protein